MSDDSVWQLDAADYPHGASMRERLSFLLRYAILAPSSHNTQPWRFALNEDTIDLHIDEMRWLRVADADRRELHISVGCALENLLIAAEHFALHGDVHYFPDAAEPLLAARVSFRPAPEMSFWRPPELFSAITRRHTNHRDFEERALPAEVLEALRDALADENIRLVIVDGDLTRTSIEALITEADARQFADPAWREELGHWLRQGVFGTGWLMSRIAALAVTYLDMGKGLGRHDVERAEHAACIACLLVDAVSPARQVQLGQAFERLFLVATLHDVQLHPMSQVLQVPALRARLANILGVHETAPQMIFRLGYAAPEHHTSRRPLPEVVVGEHSKIDGPT